MVPNAIQRGLKQRGEHYDPRPLEDPSERNPKLDTKWGKWNKETLGLVMCVRTHVSGRGAQAQLRRRTDAARDRAVALKSFSAECGVCLDGRQCWLG